MILLLFALINYSEVDSAYADVTLPSGLVVTDAQITQLLQELPKSTDDLVFYHWTTTETGLRWALQGALDSGEVNFYARPTGDRQAYGPGIYLAEGPTSSSGYGDFCVTYTIPKDTPIYDQKVISTILGQNLNYTDASALGQTIPMIRKTHSSGDWWLFTHPDLAKKIEPGHLHGAPPKVKVDWGKALLEAQGRGINDVEQLGDELTLSRYQDGISYFYRSAQGSNPRGQFEPQYFDSFRSVESGLANAQASSGQLATNSIQLGGAESDAVAWARNQVDSVLPSLYQNLGNPESVNGMFYRSEGIRSGGDELGKTFVATRGQYINMTQNPYLDVVMETIEGSDDLRIAYFYPDVFHFKQLRGKISEALYQQLDSVDPNLLWQDHALRKKLNQQIVRELLMDLFTRYHKMSLDVERNPTQVAKFIQEFISIHPFGDFSGRSTRLYLEAAFRAAKQRPPYYLLSDLDILLPPQRYGEVLKRSTKLYERYQDAAVKELFLARSQSRPPNYQGLPEYRALGSGIDSLGIKVEQLSAEQMELVRKRQWVQLFDTLDNPSWREGEFYKGVYELLYNPLSNETRMNEIEKFAQKINQGTSSEMIDFLTALTSKSATYALRGDEIISLINNLDAKKKEYLIGQQATITDELVQSLKPYLVDAIETIFSKTEIIDLPKLIAQSKFSSSTFFQWYRKQKWGVEEFKRFSEGVFTLRLSRSGVQIPPKATLEVWLQLLAEQPIQVQNKMLIEWAYPSAGPDTARLHVGSYLDLSSQASFQELDALSERADKAWKLIKFGKIPDNMGSDLLKMVADCIEMTPQLVWDEAMLNNLFSYVDQLPSPQKESILKGLVKAPIPSNVSNVTKLKLALAIKNRIPQEFPNTQAILQSLNCSEFSPLIDLMEKNPTGAERKSLIEALASVIGRRNPLHTGDIINVILELLAQKPPLNDEDLPQLLSRFSKVQQWEILNSLNYPNGLPWKAQIDKYFLQIENELSIGEFIERGIINDQLMTKKLKTPSDFIEYLNRRVGINGSYYGRSSDIIAELKPLLIGKSLEIRQTVYAFISSLGSSSTEYLNRHGLTRERFASDILKLTDDERLMCTPIIELLLSSQHSVLTQLPPIQPGPQLELLTRLVLEMGGENFQLSALSNSQLWKVLEQVQDPRDKVLLSFRLLKKLQNKSLSTMEMETIARFLPKEIYLDPNLDLIFDAKKLNEQMLWISTLDQQSSSQDFVAYLKERLKKRFLTSSSKLLEQDLSYLTDDQLKYLIDQGGREWLAGRPDKIELFQNLYLSKASKSSFWPLFQDIFNNLTPEELEKIAVSFLVKKLDLPGVLAQHFSQNFLDEYARALKFRLALAAAYDSYSYSSKQVRVMNLPDQFVKLKNPRLSDYCLTLLEETLGNVDHQSVYNNEFKKLMNLTLAFPIEKRIPLINAIVSASPHIDLSINISGFQSLHKAMPLPYFNSKLRKQWKAVLKTIVQNYPSKLGLCADLTMSSFGLFTALKASGALAGSFAFYKFFIEPKLIELEGEKCKQSGGDWGEKKYFAGEYICSCGGSRSGFDPDQSFCLSPKNKQGFPTVVKQSEKSSDGCYPQAGTLICPCDIGDNEFVYFEDAQSCQELKALKDQLHCSHIERGYSYDSDPMAGLSCECQGGKLDETPASFELRALKKLNLTCPSMLVQEKQLIQKCQSIGGKAIDSAQNSYPRNNQTSEVTIECACPYELGTRKYTRNFNLSMTGKENCPQLINEFLDEQSYSCQHHYAGGQYDSSSGECNCTDPNRSSHKKISCQTLRENEDACHALKGTYKGFRSCQFYPKEFHFFAVRSGKNCKDEGGIVVDHAFVPNESLFDLRSEYCALPIKDMSFGNCLEIGGELRSDDRCYCKGEKGGSCLSQVRKKAECIANNRTWLRERCYFD